MNKSYKTMALYMRLSREDGDRAESESIENQRRLLYGFMQKKCPDWDCTEYIDEGYSGTTFNRPSFVRLISDIERGAIEGVAVKDLSRLGREYIRTGYYIENYFPRRGIRFISANDAIDSQEEGDGGGNRELLISFKNLINDEYARDISVKVKSALRAKKESGIYACAFCQYGYRKSEDSRVEIYPEEARIVHCIFRWYLGGQKQEEIADNLNQLAILPPALSKGQYSRYKNYNGKGQSWNYQSVHRILINPCYTGRAALSKTHTISHKVKKTVKTQPERQIICTIPAIVEQADFDAVKEKIRRIRQNKQSRTKPSYLSGLLYCATCGAKMYLKKGSQKEYYVCATYKNAGNNACTSHYIDKQKLERIVLSLLHNIKLSQETINQIKKCYKEQCTSCNLTTFKINEDVNCLNNNKILNLEDIKLANIQIDTAGSSYPNQSLPWILNGESSGENCGTAAALKGLYAEEAYKKQDADDVWTAILQETPNRKQPLLRIKKIEIISHMEIIIYFDL
jgi:DNA invertase Pin-like site-specific DNA recombinase